MKKLAAGVCGLVLIMSASGCSRSFDFPYQADAERMANAAAFDKFTLGVAKFEDKRPFVEAGNPKSESFVSQYGSWKFGLTYKEVDYVPVKDIIQDLLVKELTRAGFKARAVDLVLTRDNADAIRKLGRDKVGDYVMGGQIKIFEFVNQPGMWTVTARRTALFDLAIFSVGDARLLLDTPVSENENQEYGMGVTHSINVYNLMNQVFKKVAYQIVQKTADTITRAQEPMNHVEQNAAPSKAAVIERNP